MRKPYHVVQSIENDAGNRCVDIVQTSNGTYRFQEWRRDPEDMLGWRLLLDSQPQVYATEADCLAAARLTIGWLGQSHP